MAGRRPTPTKLKLLRGNPGGRPLPVNEPEPAEGRPPKPAHLGQVAAEEWERLATLALDMRVLTVADGPILEATCTAYQQMRAAHDAVAKGGLIYAAMSTVDEKGRLVKRLMIRTNPAVAIGSEAWRRYVAGLTHLGLSPSARSRVQTSTPKKPESKLSRFTNGR